MRSEHKTTAEELDAVTDWRRVLAHLQRPGVRKSIKQRSHRRDRRRWRQGRGRVTDGSHGMTGSAEEVAD